MNTAIPASNSEQKFTKTDFGSKTEDTKGITKSMSSRTTLFTQKQLTESADEDWENDLGLAGDLAAEPKKDTKATKQVENIEVSGINKGIELTLSVAQKDINWDNEDSDDEDDPFADIFDDDDENDDTLREKQEQADLSMKSIAKTIFLLDTIAKVDTKRKEFKSDVQEAVLNHLNDLYKIFSDGLDTSSDRSKPNLKEKAEKFILHTEDKNKLIRLYGAAKFMDALEVASKNEHWTAKGIKALTAFLDSTDLIIVFCVIGILSKVLSISRHIVKAVKETGTITNTRVEILLAVSDFSDVVCDASSALTSQMFITCDGLSMLISVLSIDDYIKVSENELACRQLAERMLTEIAEIASKPERFGSNKADLCKLLVHGRLLLPLLKHLSRVSKLQIGPHPHCGNQSSHKKMVSKTASSLTETRCAECETLSSQIFAIINLLANGDNSIKRSLCNEKILKTLFSLTPTLSPPSRLSLFKVFSVLTSDSTIQQTLIENNFIPYVVPLIDKSNVNAFELNNLLLTINYTCGYDQQRFSAIIKAGAVNPLIHHARSSGTLPYRNIAISILLRLCSSTESISTFLSCGIVDFLVEITKNSQFTTNALDKLSLFCSEHKVVQLLNDPSKVCVIASLIVNSEPSSLGSIASSLHNLFGKCPGLAAKVAKEKDVLSFTVDKITRKALSNEFRVRTVELLYDLIFELLSSMHATTKNARATLEFTYHLLAPLHKAFEATSNAVLLNPKIGACIELLEDDTKTNKQLLEEKKKREKEEKKKKEREEKEKKKEEQGKLKERKHSKKI